MSNPGGGAYSSAVVRTAMQWSTMVPWCSLECTPACQAGGRWFKSRRDRHTRSPHKIANAPGRGRVAKLAERRSDEHTSELKSLMRISYAVFCLTNNITTHNQTQESK